MAKEMENEAKSKKEEVDEIVDIDKTMEFENVNNTNKEIEISEDLEKEKPTIVEDKKYIEEKSTKETTKKKHKSDKKIIFYIIGFVVIVLLGILVGWLLFKLK